MPYLAHSRVPCDVYEIGQRPSEARLTTPKGFRWRTSRPSRRGSQLVLVAGPLLFFSLFFTWQNVEVEYGRAGVATLSLDGWDAWGLLLALLVMATVAIVALGNLTDVELSDDVPWPKITLGLGTGDPRRRRREEPDGRRLVVDQLRLRRTRRRGLGRHVPRLGGNAKVRRPGSPAQAPRDQLSRLTSRTRSSPGPS